MKKICISLLLLLNLYNNFSIKASLFYTLYKNICVNKAEFQIEGKVELEIPKN
jgi:hypothetical protein